MQQQNKSNFYTYKLLLLVAAVCISPVIFAQPISGLRTICASGCDYTSIGAAVTDLNQNGVGTGGATFNVLAGHSELLTAPIVMTATGTATTPIVFQKSGTGVNPIITAYTGIKLASSTDSIDVMWAFSGSDFVTINGIDLQESTANTTPTTMMEVGYGFYKASATNGCNNNTIQNCTITLNRDNVTTTPNPSARQNASGSIGIEFVNSLRTLVTIQLTISAVSGASSNNRIYGNIIQNCNFGIHLSGFAAPSPHALADLNNEIGGASPTTGNTIINFGGGTGAASACGSMLITNQWSFSILNNTINNNTGVGVNHSGSVRGIWLFNSSAGASANVKHNTMTITSGPSTTAINWCLNVEMATTGANGNTLNLDSNSFINCVNTNASTAAFTAIWLNTAATNVNVRGNYIYGFRYSGTGTSQCILSQLACPNLNISGNIIDSTILDGAAASGTHHNIGVTSGPTVSLNMNNNIVTRTILNTAGAGSKTLYGLYYTGSTPTNNFIGNTVDSITRNGTTGGTTIGIYQAGGVNGTSTTTVRRNRVSNLSISGAGTASIMYGIQVSTGTIIVDSNEIFNLSCVKTTGTSALYGIYDISSPNNERYNNNKIYNLIHNGIGLNYGINTNTVAGTRQVFNNEIYNISTNGTAIGIVMTTSSPTILRNKIYNIRTNGAAAMAAGIRVTTLGASGFFEMAYNFIDSIQAPLCNNTTDGVRGIDLTLTTTTTNLSIFYNTIRLNAVSSGTNFSSSGLFFTSNATATTANLSLRNNIISNTSIANGSGTTNAIRFSSTATQNYNNASNHNLLYAGVPSFNNLIFFDGTNRDSTIAQYKSRIAPRDGASVSEMVTFASLVPDSATYLVPATTVPTQMESGGAPIAGFTGDFFNANNRTTFPLTGQLNGGGFAPDMGAVEFDGIAIDLTPPSISYLPITNTAATTNRVLTNFATITDGSNVDTSLTNRPRLYYKRSTESNDITGWKFVTASNATSPFSFTIDYSQLPGGFVSGGDTIEYFVVAQDLAPIPNVAINNGAFTLPANSVALSALQFPIIGSINRFNIAIPLPTTLTVGTGGTYSSFTGNGGLFESINSNVLGGNTIVTVVSDLNETGIHALNGTAFGGYNLLIEPSGTVVREISGAIATPGLFRFNNVRGLRIDGGVDKLLRFSNNSTSGPVFHFINDCSRDTLMNIQILGNNTSTGNILIGQSNGVFGNDSLLITQCYFKDSFAIPTTHINASGSASATNSYNIISRNEFVNFSANAINITSGGNGDNWTIYGNTNYQTASRITAISCIFVQTGNGHLIRANSIGGSAPNRSGTPFTNTSSFIRGIELTGSAGAATLIDSNLFSNIVTTSTAGVFGVLVNSGNAIINANTFGGAANTWDTIQNGYDNGIISILGGTSITITNNLIGNIRYIKTGGDRTAGMLISGAVPALTVQRNIVRDINHSGSGTGTSIFRPCGILVNGAVSNGLIADNTIFNINSTNTGTAAYVVSGIFITNTGFINNTIARNRIYNIGTAGSASPTAYGIQITSQGAGNRYLNNQISIGNNTSAQTLVAALRDESTAAEAWVYNNSIFVNGNIDGGANHSYGIQRTSTSNMILRNNIVYNKRTTTGTGFAFATGSTNNTNITTNTSNYNLFIVNDTARVSEFPTGISYGAFIYNNGLFAPTFNTNWIEGVNNVPAHLLFVDTLNGLLDIDTNSAAAWYANGKGLPIAGLTGDFYNVSGVRSGSIVNGPVDIGAVEFNTNTTPPVALADKAPALLDSTQFYFANRLIGKMVWNMGPVPPTVDVRYYSGVLPQNTPGNVSRMFGYYHVNSNFVVGYDATLTVMWDSAVLGNLQDANRVQLARYTGTGNTWFRHTNGFSNAAMGMVTANQVSLDGNFTLTDSAVNPLPVQLVSFGARLIGNDVKLNWSTATEKNNRGFYIERSDNGIDFNEIGFVKGFGNTNIKQYYTFSDVNPFNGIQTLYYRLRQVDRDESYVYSRTIPVNVENNENNMLLFPNPATSFTQVEFVANGTPATIEVKDLNGRLVYELVLNTTDGVNTVFINELNGFDAGVYVVSIKNNGSIKTAKLVKQ